MIRKSRLLGSGPPNQCRIAVKLFVNREDEEGAPSESGRTGAIGKNSKYKVCLDRHDNDHVVESRTQQSFWSYL